MKKMIMLMLCMAAALSVQARIGKTYDQCVSQYGAPITEFEGGYAFETKSFELLVIFKDQPIALMVAYMKKDGRIYDDEKLDILKANGTGWKKFDPPAEVQDRYLGHTFWKNSAGSLGHYDPFKDRMDVHAPLCSDHLWKTGASTAGL
jgi:hypothetical protein